MALQQVSISQGSGTKILTNEVTTTVQGSSQTVEQQLMGLADPTTLTNIAGVVAKGTQAGFALGVQDFKDAGRNVSTLFSAGFTITTSSEALLSLTGYKAGAAVAATTTPAVVTTGKTFRITSMVLTYVAISTAGLARFTLRANTSGVVAVTSPAVSNWFLGASAATAGISQSLGVDFDEGLEFAAGTGIGLSMIGYGATGTATAVGYGMCSLYGYEY